MVEVAQALEEAMPTLMEVTLASLEVTLALVEVFDAPNPQPLECTTLQGSFASTEVMPGSNESQRILDD